MRSINDAMKQLKQDLDRKARPALAEGLAVLDQASSDVIPVDLGPLKASKRINVTGRGLDAVGKISFNADYALRVHEDPSLLHGQAYNWAYARQIAAGSIEPYSGRPYHSRGAQQDWKYLENPLKLNAKQILAAIFEALLD